MTKSPTGNCAPSCINHARFAAMSAHLAQVAAKASTNSLQQLASAYDRMEMDHVLRFLDDVRRIADAILEVAAESHSPAASEC
jgi:hypothetical protein